MEILDFLKNIRVCILNKMKLSKNLVMSGCGLLSSAPGQVVTSERVRLTSARYGEARSYDRINDD